MTTAIMSRPFGLKVILSLQEATLNWYREIGLNPAGTSIEEAFTNVQYIQNELAVNRGAKLIVEKGLTFIYFSSANARTYIEIFEGLRKTPSHQLPKGELKQILHIPLIPHDEDVSKANHHGRNFMFQFELASFLIKSGIKVNSFDDIEIEFQNRPLWFECKRVHSKRRVLENIAAAHDQFHKKHTRYDQKGIIAVAIEKILGQHDLVHVVESREQLLEKGHEIIREFAEQANEIIPKLKRSRIIAILYYLKYTGNYNGTLEMLPMNLYSVHSLRTKKVETYNDWEIVENLISHCNVFI